MTLSRQLFALSGLLALAGSASAQQCIDYSVTSSINSLGALGSGQTFFPEDVPGYGGQPTLDLTGLSFWSGNLGGAGHPTTYVAIYDGNPDTATLVGTSTNFVDTSAAAGLPNYTELQWTFSSLTLNASTEYWAVLSSSTSDVNPTDTVGRSLQVFDPNNDAYRGTSVIANRNPHGSGLDLRFLACFAGGPPAPVCIDYGTTNSINSLGGLGSGQTFFPEDASGYGGQATLDLTGLSLWTGNLGGAGHPTTYVAIYDGNPDSAALVGTSTNSVDTSAAAGIPNYTELQWTFSSLTLNAGAEYWAVLSSSPMDVNPTDTVGRSLQVFDPNNDAYRGTSVIADRNPHGSGLDLRFVACFGGGGGLGTNYCGPATPNSTGFPGEISATGSVQASANNVVLTASSLPTGQFGYFLAGQTQGFFNPPASQGFICLSGNIGRYNGGSQIIQGPSGDITLDLTSIPVNPSQAVQAGETWNFQCWYRDANPGTTSNFTDGLSISFQ